MINQKKFDLIEDLIATAVAKERERCAKLCDEYAADCEKGSSVTSIAEDIWGVAHARQLAILIRKLKS